ncbi:hypothetical protein VTJ49DRAFT_6429 [Mycothermus thermophilus]|uniref:Glucan 1, 4-alpha-glucosidase n=1 Tax=Humicola insolens TaxID=85995 RepID=A0ABR3VJZ7_HUMIN
MDDPWDSPWAAPDADSKDPKLASSPAKSDLAPPPRALLSPSNSPRLPSVLDQSPWAGDGGGDVEWGVPEPPVHSIWAGGWGSGSSSPHRALTPRDEALGQDTSIAWPASLATPKQSSGFAIRQPSPDPSPDPWANAFSTGPTPNDGVETPRLAVQDASPVEAPTETPRDNGLGLVEEPVWDTPEDEAGGMHHIATADAGPDQVASDTTDESPAEQLMPTPNDRDGTLGTDPGVQVHEDQSSTPSHETTDHEEEHQESPHTSDEELIPRRPVARKVSGKVQELVDKFDGLAKTASEEPPVIRARSKSPLGVGKKDDLDDADFGDFEEANGHGLVPPESAVSEPPSPPVRNQDIDAAAAVSSPAPDAPYSSTSPTAKFGSLDFAVDLSLIGKLFGDLEQHSRNPKAEDDVPDYIVQDSFTEISQRKTWYRISRLGSSRRHDAADDDSYRRVTWSTSTVHDETIKIVRRWMEEDSIAGRVQLGGGISKTQKNMFGWDSTAEPVALEAVFGKKKTHSRNTSLQPPKTSVNGVSGADAAGSHRPSGRLGSAVASFSWSSSPISSQPTNGTPGHQTPSTTSAPRNPDVSTTKVPPMPAPPVVPKPTISALASLPKTQPPQTQTAIEDDDEDEWGEMVSSPVTSQPPAATSLSTVPTTLDAVISTTSEPPPVPPTGPAASAATAPNNDPWGSVDFSIFETPPTKQATSPATPKPAEPALLGPTPAVLADVATAPGPAKKPPTTGSLRTSSQPRGGKPNTITSGMQLGYDEDPDEVAERILRNLPDLSYMLR